MKLLTTQHDLQMQTDNIIAAESFNSHNEYAKGSRKKRKSDLFETQGTKQVQKARMKGKGKGKVGQLEGLMSIPMDVLFEVHLLPVFCGTIPPDAPSTDIWPPAPT